MLLQIETTLCNIKKDIITVKPVAGSWSLKCLTQSLWLIHLKSPQIGDVCTRLITPVQTAGGLVSVLKSFHSSSNHVVGDAIIRQKSEAFPEKNTQFHCPEKIVSPLMSSPLLTVWACFVSSHWYKRKGHLWNEYKCSHFFQVIMLSQEQILSKSGNYFHLYSSHTGKCIWHRSAGHPFSLFFIWGCCDRLSSLFTETPACKGSSTNMAAKC